MEGVVLNGIDILRLFVLNRVRVSDLQRYPYTQTWVKYHPRKTLLLWQMKSVSFFTVFILFQMSIFSLKPFYRSASHERSAFFVCNRLHWLPKDDCIFAVGFLKMTTFWKPNSEYYNKQKMSLIFCHIRFVTVMHELGWWNSFLMACCTCKMFLSRFQMRSLLWIFLPGFKLFVFHLSCSLPLTLKSMKHRAVCTKICQIWKISIFSLQ